MITLEWGLSKVVGKIESQSAPRARRKTLENLCVFQDNEMLSP
jgi:hypothetical protein